MCRRSGTRSGSEKKVAQTRTRLRRRGRTGSCSLSNLRTCKRGWEQYGTGNQFRDGGWRRRRPARAQPGAQGQSRWRWPLSFHRWRAGPLGGPVHDWSSAVRLRRPPLARAHLQAHSRRAAQRRERARGARARRCRRASSHHARRGSLRGLRGAGGPRQRLDRFLPPVFFRPPRLRGTFAPFFLASDSPIAIACLRLFTFLPLLPDRSVPFLRRRIALSTRFDAPFPYFRRPEDLRAAMVTPRTNDVVSLPVGGA